MVFLEELAIYVCKLFGSSKAENSIGEIARKSENSIERPVGAVFFAGAGGMCLGFERAGFDITAAVEFDPVHAQHP